MRNEVPLNVGAQHMDASGYQVSDLEDIKFHWKNPDLNMDAVFRPGTDTPFSLQLFFFSELGSMADNTILIDQEEDKENSLLTSPVSEIPRQEGIIGCNCSKLFGEKPFEKKTCNGTRLDFRIKKDVKHLIWNLTKRKKHQCIIWNVVQGSIQNLTRRKIFNSESDTSYNFLVQNLICCFF